MRIRQLVFVARERDELAQQICDLFELKETFNDPGIIHFGLEGVTKMINIGRKDDQIYTLRRRSCHRYKFETKN